MKIAKLRLINYKGIKDVEIMLNDRLCFLVSANNVGKTRVLEAIDDFYNNTRDDTIQIELTYEFDEEEIKKLDSKLVTKVSSDNTLAVLLEKKKRQIDGINVDKFYKDTTFGSVVYIPAVSNHEDETNVSKTSTSISKMINDIAKTKLVAQLGKVNNSIEEYVKALNLETKGLMGDINTNLLFSDVKVALNNRDVKSDQILKNNISLDAFESGSSIPSNIQNLGSGVQRNIVNTILAHYGKHADCFTLVLYDEPETFISSFSQRELICNINNNIGSSTNLQYIVATHSPDIIYRNTNIHKKIIRLKAQKDKNIQIFQYDESIFLKYVNSANEELEELGADEKHLLSTSVEETILSFWDRYRINTLFENKSLLVEGPTEEVLLDLAFSEDNIPYTTSLGKFSFPYLYILLSKVFGVKLVAIYDKDGNSGNHYAFNTYIDNHFYKILSFDPDLETKLGYTVGPSERNNKPRIFLKNYFDGTIKENVDELKEEILNIWNES